MEGAALPLSSWQYSSPVSVTPPRGRVAAEKAARGPRLSLPGLVPVSIPNSSPTGRRWTLLPGIAGAPHPVGPRRAALWSRGATVKALYGHLELGGGPDPITPVPSRRAVSTDQCFPSHTEHQPAPHRRVSPQCQRVCVPLTFRDVTFPQSKGEEAPLGPRMGFPSPPMCPTASRVGGQLASAESSAASTCPRLKPWVLPASATSEQKVTRYRDTIPCSPISFTFHHAHAFLLKILFGKTLVKPESRKCNLAPRVHFSGIYITCCL